MATEYYTEQHSTWDFSTQVRQTGQPCGLRKEPVEREAGESGELAPGKHGSEVVERARVGTETSLDVLALERKSTHLLLRSEIQPGSSSFNEINFEKPKDCS